MRQWEFNFTWNCYVGLGRSPQLSAIFVTAASNEGFWKIIRTANSFHSISTLESDNMIHPAFYVQQTAQPILISHLCLINLPWTWDSERIPKKCGGRQIQLKPSLDCWEITNFVLHYINEATDVLVGVLMAVWTDNNLVRRWQSFGSRMFLSLD